MLHIKEVLCLGGDPDRANEDRVGWGENFLFVIDGATGLTGERVMPADSDALWLSQGLAGILSAALPASDRDLGEILSQAAEKLRSAFDPRWRERHPDLPPDYPSAGVTIFRLLGDTLEYLGLGDCPGVVELKNGRREVLEETALTALDQIVLTEMSRLVTATGCSMTDARRQVNPLLIAHRKRTNHPDGYWIFDPTGAGIPHARRKRWKRSDVASLSAMTDGFGQLVSPFGLFPDLSSLHQGLQNKGAARLASLLFSAQEGDWGCERYPRFKPRDDLGVLFGTIGSL